MTRQAIRSGSWNNQQDPEKVRQGLWTVAREAYLVIARDVREKRDGSKVSSSRVTPVAHVLPVSLTIHAQEQRSASAAETVKNDAG